MLSQPTHPVSRGATAWAAAGLFLGVLFVATSLFKVAGNFSMPEFDPQDPTVFYWSESAVQYRHARMVAEGQGIPAHDVALQYPEGVRTFRTLTVLMEYPAGWTYRLLRAAGIDVAFHEFLVWWVSFFYSLALVPAYVLAWRLYRSHLSAVLTTLLYTLSLATIGRQFGTFGREHFALPWLFTALALLVMSLAPPGPEASRRRQWAPPIAAAAALVVGLAAWHFSRFIFLVLAASLSAAFLFARREHLPRLTRTLGVIVAFVLPAGILVPALRAAAFWASPGLLILLATSAAVVLERRTGWLAASDERRPSLLGLPVPLGRLLRLLTCLAVVTPLPLLLGAESGGYGHVWALLLAKIRFLGIKPADPGELTFAQRSLWIEAFRSPQPSYVLLCFWAHLLLVGTAAWRRALRARRSGFTRPWKVEPVWFLVLVPALAFTGLFLLVLRLAPVASFFLSVVAGGAFYALEPRRRRLAVAALVPVVLVLAYDFVNANGNTPWRSWLRRLDPPAETRDFGLHWTPDQRKLVRWITANTPPDAVFLSRIGEAPLLLAHTGRAIVLQPKWEAPGIRVKVRELLAALYSSEEALATFCEKYGVTHVLHSATLVLSTGPDSMRYMGDALRLSTAAPAYRMQFQPEALQRFELTYTGAAHRIYRLTETAPRDGAGSFLYQPLFDLRRFGGQTAGQAVFDDAFSGRVVSSLHRAVTFLERGRALLAARQTTAARRHLEDALRRNPSLTGAHTLLGMALVAQAAENPDAPRLLQEALNEVTIETRISPEMPLAHHNLGYVRSLAGQYEEALAAWTKCRELDPDFPGLAENIARLEGLLAQSGESGAATPDA